MSDNVFEARVLPRRMDGDVEVVRMELFTPDGTPFGGSIPEETVEERIFFVGSSALFAVPSSNIPTRHNFATLSPAYFGGFEITPGAIGSNGISDIPASKGLYLVRASTIWNFADGKPATGFTSSQLWLVDSEDHDYSSYSIGFQQFNTDQVVIPQTQVVYVPSEGMHWELEAYQSSTGQIPDATISTEIVKL